MPNIKQFKSHEEYLQWYREYRDKNREKIRKYNSKYNSVWRKKNGYHNESKWKKNNKKKYDAEQKLNYYIRKGIIKKENCEICKKRESVHAHHENYNFFLHIHWLCPLHHKSRHLNNQSYWAWKNYILRSSFYNKI